MKITGFLQVVIPMRIPLRYAVSVSKRYATGHPVKLYLHLDGKAAALTGLDGWRAR